MAISTTAKNTGMVHRRTAESTGTLMASLARSRGLDMVAWFANGSATVMAIGTT